MATRMQGIYLILKFPYDTNNLIYMLTFSVPYFQDIQHFVCLIQQSQQ